MGAKVEPSTPARARSRTPINEAIRDWVANVADTHYVIGSAVGRIRSPRSCATSSA